MESSEIKTVLDTTLTPGERREWHARLLEPKTWRQLRELAEAMEKRCEDDA